MARDDCHMFMWTTQKFQWLAKELIELYGFRPMFTMVWHKAGGFQPVGLPQFNCEFVIYGRKGSAKFTNTSKFSCCFNAPRREHSRKPDEFYDIVSLATKGPRIDVFSREPREGFAQFGDDTDHFVEPASELSLAVQACLARHAARMKMTFAERAAMDAMADRELQEAEAALARRPEWRGAFAAHLAYLDRIIADIKDLDTAASEQRIRRAMRVIGRGRPNGLG
jgi:N6-adenosine-specific RNA methylase IME4